ncbi:hypothetical protein QFC21_006791 [Naganishia friedmannii]|uniref:Uncharacterized protein n=1 Tax=Naganishia friedmannii TaxID=89922 RepID=A0ACC2UZQ6_9TREE|nr:hypothetical protein QFC21_006791 [Naganishia friedmannii]
MSHELDRSQLKLSLLLEKVMKGSVNTALSADILGQHYRSELEAQTSARERRNGDRKRVRTKGRPITIDAERKIDDRLVQEAEDAEKKREWERISATLYTSYQANPTTEAELLQALPAAVAQGKTRNLRSDKGKKLAKLLKGCLEASSQEAETLVVTGNGV